MEPKRETNSFGCVRARVLRAIIIKWKQNVKKKRVKFYPPNPNPNALNRLLYTHTLTQRALIFELSGP